MLTAAHHAALLPLAQHAGFQNLDLMAHQLLGGRYSFTALGHSNYVNCQLLAQGVSVDASLEEFLHTVRQELLALAPVAYAVVGEAYRIAA
jgi:hypothetical protein